jgi:hypothetical protein
LLDRTVNLNIKEAYSKIKKAMLDRGCKLISEESSNKINFKQGSLWGISPKTAKKNINVNLETVNEGTRVSCTSTLASDWKNITLIGCAFACILVGLCVWMAMDLSALVANNVPGFWGWLVTFNGNVDLMAAQAFVHLTWGLAGFLSVVILLEAVIVIYTHSKIDLFAEEILNQLS